jgi:hypothetical protein
VTCLNVFQKPTALNKLKLSHVKAFDIWNLLKFWTCTLSDLVNIDELNFSLLLKSLLSDLIYILLFEILLQVVALIFLILVCTSLLFPGFVYFDFLNVEIWDSQICCLLLLKIFSEMLNKGIWETQKFLCNFKSHYFILLDMVNAMCKNYHDCEIPMQGSLLYSISFMFVYICICVYIMLKELFLVNIYLT